MWLLSLLFSYNLDGGNNRFESNRMKIRKLEGKQLNIKSQNSPAHFFFLTNIINNSFLSFFSSNSIHHREYDRFKFKPQQETLLTKSSSFFFSLRRFKPFTSPSLFNLPIRHPFTLHHHASSRRSTLLHRPEASPLPFRLQWPSC